MKPIAPLLALAYGAPRAPGGDGVPRRILLIRRNGIGDMICALPLVRRIRAGFPQARLDVLASERNAPLLEHGKLADRVIVYRRGRGLLRNHYFNLPRLMRPIRAEHYDLVVAMTGGFSKLVAVLTYATGAPCRVGFVPAAGHALDFCFEPGVPQPDVREHQIERCLRLADALGIAAVPIDVGFALGAEDERYAANTLASHGLEPGRFVLYNVSSSRLESAWTAERIALTAAELARRHGLPTLACGLPLDRTLLAATRLPQVVTPRVHEFAALVRRAKFLMCSDGGAMHVAAAMKTPAFVLFATADPQTWRPWGVAFDYVRSGTRVADIEPPRVLERLARWLPALERDGISARP